MERNIFEKQRELNDRLNRYRDEYYNRNAPSVSDEVYDRLFDELKELEQETGIQMANSPTQTVGYPAVSRLEKTRHEIPLLSLDKTKSSMVLLNFMGEQQVMLMLKLDGLTVKLTYENGELLEAATRGDGDEGEIITHNTRAISGIPSHITYKERLVVTGEGFIRPSDFEELKTSLQDSSGKPYKNGRNLAAGSIRLMDAKTCRERRLVFMPFGVLEGFPHLTRKSDKLRELRALGFQPCKYLVTKQKLTLENVEAGIYQLRQYATDKDIPIDGIVVSFNDIAYAQSCGRTGHHYKDGLAYKFEDDLHESLLQYIEWTPGRTGEIAPVAVFTPVEIDGCEVSRASLHNLSFIEDLELMAGNRILVKNLVTIPINRTKLVLSKMLVLLLFAVGFMAVGGLVNLAVLLFQGWEPVGFWTLFGVGIEEGLIMWVGALPCILLVVLLNKNYIVSVVITFFYTTANYILSMSDAFLTQPFGLNIGTLFPGPLAFRWTFQFYDQSQTSAELADLLERISPYFLNGVQVFGVIVGEAVVFLALIALVYRRQEI